MYATSYEDKKRFLHLECCKVSFLGLCSKVVGTDGNQHPFFVKKIQVWQMKGDIEAKEKFTDIKMRKFLINSYSGQIELDSVSGIFVTINQLISWNKFE